MGGDGDEEWITLLFFYCVNENPVIEREGLNDSQTRLTADSFLLPNCSCAVCWLSTLSFYMFGLYTSSAMCCLALRLHLPWLAYIVLWKEGRNLTFQPHRGLCDTHTTRLIT